MISLLFVGLGTGEKHAAEDEDLKEEDTNVVPGVGDGVVDTELKDTPPVETVEDVEADQGEHDSDVVREIVLVEALVITLVDRVISVTVALLEGLLL